MKIQKLGGSLAAAISIFALSAPVLADHTCGEVITNLKGQAADLRCETDIYGDYLETEVPIWQFKGKTSAKYGCQVHDKLAKLLHELRTTEPPPQGGKNGNGNGNNQARGAANDLDDDKFDSAIDQLMLFWNTIEYDAKLNMDDYPNSEDRAREQQDLALIAIDDINNCRNL